MMSRKRAVDGKAEGSKKPKLELQNAQENERMPDLYGPVLDATEDMASIKHGNALTKDKMEMTAPLTPPAEHNQPLFKPAAGTHRISMGFMADCEQCQKGVRGHYVHWIPNQTN